MKNKSILKNKFFRIFDVAPGVHRENSGKFGLKRDFLFISFLSRTEVNNINGR